MDLISSLFIHELEEKMRNHHPSASASSVKKYFPCDALVSFVAEFKPELSDRKTLKGFVRHIIKLLLEYDCPSFELLRGIIDLFYVSQDELSLLNTWDKPMLLFGQIIPSALEKLITCSQIPKKFMKEHTLVHFRDTVKSLKIGDLNFMKLLIKYGFTSASKAKFYPQIFFDCTVLDTLYTFL